MFRIRTILFPILYSDISKHPGTNCLKGAEKQQLSLHVTVNAGSNLDPDGEKGFDPIESGSAYLPSYSLYFVHIAGILSNYYFLKTPAI